MLPGKKIVVGVCGSIAAYKAAVLIRQLVKEGAEVKVVMTTSATEFITPLTLSTLSGNPVHLSFTKEGDRGEWNNHVALGLWADLMIIAPASANTIAKMANGLCDNLLLAVYLSARCPVYIAPAMDLDMYAHPSTKHNLSRLTTFGDKLIAPEHGELASGLVGTGRMAEPESIVEVLKNYFSHNIALSGKKFLITAGPTYESLDPVRYIGNHSSGKMGYALAREVARKGGEVVLVSGPTHEVADNAHIRLIHVTSAQEMHDACIKEFNETDVAILSAAVADYKPKQMESQKIKKSSEVLSLELVKTPDIAATLGKLKKKQQLIIGFALETENEIANAGKKLKAKNFDLVVLNSLNQEGAGFGHNTNKISIIDRQNNIRNFELKSKAEVASDIVKAIMEVYHA